MSDIFREVEEEVRRDKMVELVQTYGTQILAGAIVIVGAVGGYSLWNWSVEREKAALSDKYNAAAELALSDDTVAALEAFAELADDGRGGYRVLALFHQAGTLVETGNREKAVEIYDRVSSDGAASRELRDLARIKAALVLVDLADVVEIRRRVSGLIESQSPFRFSAREAIALAAFADGGLEEARSEFQLLAFDPLTPVNLRSRAQEMLIILGPPAGGESAEAEIESSDTAGEESDPDADANVVPGNETAGQASE